MLARRLGEEFRDIAMEIGLHVTIALRLAPERARGMDEGVVVHLNERLERDVEAPAIIKAPTKRCIITE